jgi:hypothetical protein
MPELYRLAHLTVGPGRIGVRLLTESGRPVDVHVSLEDGRTAAWCDHERVRPDRLDDLIRWVLRQTAVVVELRGPTVEAGPCSAALFRGEDLTC